MANGIDCDLAIVGGGLAGSLVALAFARLRPDVCLVLIERDGTLGGNHIWSFFDGDVGARDRWLIDPMIAHRWPQGYEVRFPAYRRRIDTPYNSMTSAALDAHVRQILGDRVVTDAAVQSVEPQRILLADGRTVTARAVLDTLGGRDFAALRCGWQKFVGHALRLRAPHGVDRPVIMDATVEQIDGYRFIYLLPWDDQTLFVEDTYYSDGPELDIPALDARIATYAAGAGWDVETILHRESGALPVVHGGDFDRFWPREDGIARGGVHAGLFHPMTGYSLPDAVAFALWVVDQPLEGLAAATRGRAAAHWRAGRFYRLLAKMLFHAATPENRWPI
ncbi:MAG TPA: lycopene beta-cyclase CrtY, partial [Sphingobium sp.]|nr:lycopene beta-cyclase CrtY [Sphingobium sp.]